MMDVHDLVAKVANELEMKGFDVDRRYYADDEKMYQAYAVKDSKYKRRQVEGRNISLHDWFKIEVFVVNRHNGAEENISADISIYEYKSSLGKRIAKERINVKMGERAVMSRINKIVDMYESL